MSSEVEICNSAITKVGGKRITSLDDDTVAGRVCNAQYSVLRDEVLRAYPWNFALARVELAQLTSTPAFEFAYQYQLPANCLRLLALSDPDIVYALEGRKILTDETTVKIKYTKLVTDPNLMDTLFRATLSYRLAADLAYPIQQAQSLVDTMYSLYQQSKLDAEFIDSSETTNNELDTGTWVESRI